MEGVLYENSILAFIFFTVLLGGGAAFQTGRAVAQTWQPIWQLALYVVLIAATIRFLCYAVIGETLLSLQYYLIDYVVMLVAAVIGWRLRRAQQMTTQYRWLFEPSGPFGWKAKP